jgi:hypothetical protein
VAIGGSRISSLADVAHGLGIRASGRVTVVVHKVLKIVITLASAGPAINAYHRKAQ